MACWILAKTWARSCGAKGMVEKPKAEDAPSNLAVIGRYILTPKVLTNLNRMKQGAGGEIQLTDAIAEETRRQARCMGSASVGSAMIADRRRGSCRRRWRLVWHALICAMNFRPI